jgi:flavin reductase (DIM6/NTAB) family NADH-FMN oxidoreductase RutF
MEFDFEGISARERYKLLSATVTPRPIAWVSSLNEDASSNAAPFSYFCALGEDPAILGISVQTRGLGERKDTEENIRREMEFVVNLVAEENLEKMNVTAIEFPSVVSEFNAARLTPGPSSHVRTPRIAESPVSFECKLFDIVSLGSNRSLILGQVVAMHICDNAVISARNCHIDTAKLGLVGKMGPGDYVRTTDIIQLPMISLESWSAARST